MLKITLPDGSVKTYEEALSPAQIAGRLSNSLAKAAVAARVNGRLADLTLPLHGEVELSLLTFDDEEGQAVFRHSSSHILAAAVQRLFPGAKLGIGPAIKNGFYYDFDCEHVFTNEDFAAIEAEMEKIVKEDLPFRREELSRGEALSFFNARGEKYKVELINDLPADAVIGIYRNGDFVDLCAGPHLPGTGRVKAFKLLSLAGAYWRGSEKNKMLQRIYATSFPKQAELDEYLAAVEEAKKRDHNKIGRELEYFTTVDYIGQGLPILMPNGAKVLQLLQRFVEDEEERRGYMLTKTPFMAKRDLYKISGHWDHYRDGMFILGDPDGEGEVLAMRPMTCPFQFQVYLARSRSYRDLPMRFNETSSLFRNESSGEMHGLIRVRQFTLSEGHIICRPDQLEAEFAGCVDLAVFMLKTLGLDGDVGYRFSKWDENNKEKYIGSAEEWESVQARMRAILDEIGVDYYEAAGEAAFYGPKLDVQIKNVHGKEDTLITIQIDFQLASRFGMEYADADGQKKFPYVIHRSSIGCYERTLALLIEKYAGAFPLWLAPVQVRVMNITDNQLVYAKEVQEALQAAGLRAELDGRNEKIGFKIRCAQAEKVPYMLVVGDKEMQSGSVAVRHRNKGDLGSRPLAELTGDLLAEIRDKTR
ncbi:MAG: threonine--tRNA ligase [Clostridiales bacterium]|nr:threonine--tRNA ligase [Clostridiales bacterium]